ncbi:MAG: rhamnose/proton symporter RhaT, partial [Armatimonadetes bacterium]|nr:rhamnose/proton symporter RhaT [Armatimonadota bacterium]
ALGYAVALGLCALFGTLVPPIVNGEIAGMLGGGPGRVVLLGVVLCLFGIALSGKAGKQKEVELPAEAKQETIEEFDFAKGLLVAIFAGVMSACMAFAFQAAKPLTELAILYGTPKLWSNLPVLVIALLGGFTTNVIWCRLLMDRNGTTLQFIRQEADGRPVPLAANYLFCALAGLAWYLQFFFYGMGTTKMGTYDFTSWSIHMACIIIFSTLWGIALKEWKGTSRATHAWIAAGLLVLVLSVGVIGYGNKLVADAAKAAEAITSTTH